MKPYFLIWVSLILLTSESVHAQKTLTFNAAYTADFARNIKGGLEQNNAYLGNLDLTVSFDTENANWWKGGQFFAYILNNHGCSLSQYIGDIQGVDNIEAEANTRLYQLWYQQNFRSFSFLIGQHDFNSEFSSTEFGSTLINSSFGIQPDISANVPVSIFPVATLGVILNLKLSDQLVVATGLYDGDPGTQEFNPNSLDPRLDPSEGLMSVVEFRFLNEIETNLNTSLKIGAWFHTNDSDYGFYGILDQRIFNETEDKSQGLGIFTQIGIAPSKNSVVDYYYSFGIHYKGIFKERNDDNLVLAFGSVNILNDSWKNQNRFNIKNETVIEFSYQAKINKYFSIHPDLQYVINPGTEGKINNAFVGILRLVLEY